MVSLCQLLRTSPALTPVYAFYVFSTYCQAKRDLLFPAQDYPGERLCSSIPEIGAGFKIASTNGVSDQLNKNFRCKS